VRPDHSHDCQGLVPRGRIWVTHTGNAGFLTLLFVPLGNDILVLALCARYHERMLYYVADGYRGIADRLLSDGLDQPKKRKQPEEIFSGKRLASIREIVKKRAAWALCRSFALAAAVSVYGDSGPPRRPFRYPRRKRFTFNRCRKIRAFSDRRGAGGSLRALDHQAGGNRHGSSTS